MAANPIAVPLIITPAGPQPTPASNLRSAVQQAVAAIVPGYTADLPGTLIEDLLSTEMGALTTIDQARVDAINGAIPATASPYFLYQLGAQFGTPQGQAQNTSALVTFGAPVGQVIPAGWIVSDGTYQYVLQAPGTIIGSNGQSPLVEVVATTPGIWTPQANTITTSVTPAPPEVTITVNNPEQGTPGTTAQSVANYRAQVMQVYQMPAQSLVQYLLGQLQNISGVNPLYAAVRQSTTGWQVICGGGDPYQIALAIFNSVGDISTLVGASAGGTSQTVTVTIQDGANSYQIVYVEPAAQIVTCQVTWNTNLPNFTQGGQVSQLMQPAVVSYFNSIPVGQPINLNALTAACQNAASGILAPANLTTLEFLITVNGAQVSPEAGTQMILSDPESYFSCASNAATVTQG